VPIYNTPLFPLLEVPVLSKILPLTPLAPEFAVVNTSDPLEDPGAYPLLIITRPPVAPVDGPDESNISPPAPLLPEPTVKYRPPPRPDRAEPLPTITAPLVPLLDVPVLITNMPLVPDTPAFDVIITTPPLLDDEL